MITLFGFIALAVLITGLLIAFHLQEVKQQKEVNTPDAYKRLITVAAVAAKQNCSHCRNN